MVLIVTALLGCGMTFAVRAIVHALATEYTYAPDGRQLSSNQLHAALQAVKHTNVTGGQCYLTGHDSSTAGLFGERIVALTGNAVCSGGTGEVTAYMVVDQFRVYTKQGDLHPPDGYRGAHSFQRYKP